MEGIGGAVWKRNVRDALSEARNQMEAGLIQGGVFAAQGREPVAFGLQTVHPEAVPMTAESRFDIASVGKVFTASCCAALAAEGKLDPDAPFTEYLPDHILGAKCRITVRDFATHSSGFTNDKPYAKDDPEAFYRELMRMKPVRERGEAFEYSCYGFILLGVILNRLTGKDLDTLAREIVWGPLGMTHTTWNAPGDGPDEVEHWYPNRPAGRHNDDVCFRVNVPLGSGSCFSTCGDMMKFVRDIAERRHFPQAYYDLLTTCCWEGRAVQPGGTGPARRSFGWDMCADRRPETFSDRAVFHSGWTGQTIAVDPVRGLGAMIMTSRTGDWELANRGRARLINILCRK